MNILFGISDTLECRNAIKFAIKLAHSLKTVRFTLLHVSMEVFIYSESGMMDYGTTEALEEERAKDLLKEFEDAFKKENIECESVLKSGDSIDVVLGMAKDYDLLLIGASESNLLYRLFGSHQNRLIEQSSIPIMVAK
ncbi:universal stress protein [Helicobacter cetorum]|uniref:Putative universal stress global response regulator UspA n=1 Tax=Helicobacter cetorum (strain ATCC BAA-540 / CCUG 52418 / MIT 99-5656) TaxID=1163745 RepID=I0EQ38_HELCM|nr:universal stress protein [Helicobacter cetorum]AFI05057.1 putative universal stress global response regulator UspA [Helicobacter cetorum MIT 99-5656]